MSKILSYLHSKSWQSMAYALILLAIFLFVAFVFLRSLVFSAHVIDTLLTEPDASGQASFFNLGQFSKISTKLRIVLSESSTASSTVLSSASSTETAASPKSPLRILNATGRSGLAKEWQEKFENAGFSSVTVGNSDVDLIGIEIRYSASQAESVVEIRKILEANDASGVTEKAIPEGSPILIIFGKES